MNNKKKKTQEKCFKLPKEYREATMQTKITKQKTQASFYFYCLVLILL